MTKILSFGSCNIDHVYNIQHIVEPGETISAKKFSQFPGGKGLNQTIAIARAGSKVSFAGCIGSDGVWLSDLLRNNGVDVEFLKILEIPTGHAIIQVDEKGENAIFLYSGANGMITEQYIDEVLNNFEAGDILLLQNEISNIFYLAQQAYKKGMKIVLNPSPFGESLKTIPLNWLYAVVLNETEAANWAGTNDFNDFITMIKNMKTDLHVVITLGSKGCVYFHKEETCRQNVFSVKVVDTTGAGDTFMGYFISCLTRNMPMPKILEISCAASAIAVSRAGAAVSIPVFEEVESFIKNRIN